MSTLFMVKVLLFQSQWSHARLAIFLRPPGHWVSQARHVAKRAMRLHATHVDVQALRRLDISRSI